MGTDKAVFLDRDGTIIFDTGYIRDPELIKFLPGAFAGLKSLQEIGYKLIIVTNQSGIGRGRITMDEYQQVQLRVLNVLAENGVSISQSYFCPHTPETECSCRKPKPEMILKAAEELKIDLSQSIMIGDKYSDVEAGMLAGCQTMLLNHSNATKIGNYVRPDHICTDWFSIAQTLS